MKPKTHTCVCLSCDIENELDGECQDCEMRRADRQSDEVQEHPEYWNDGTNEDEIHDLWEIQEKLK